jgi:membrane protein implicated in regulation of membrane protease activity
MTAPWSELLSRGSVRGDRPASIMLSLYLAGFLFGGVLIAGSLLGGHGGHGDGTHDGVAGHDAHDPGHAHGEGRNLLGRLPFLSLRFWAFATAFFGLSGAALTVAGLGATVPAIAGVVGLSCGALASRVLGRLGRQSVGLIGDASGHLGREAQVLLPVAPGRRGKIRLSIGGTSVDLVAEMEGATAGLARGEQAYIVGLRGNVALVERSPTALPPTSHPTPGKGPT